MDIIIVSSIILAIFIVGLFVTALINLRKAKTVTPAKRSMMRNDAKLLLSCSALFTGCLLLIIATAPFSIPTFDWIIDPLLLVTAFALAVGAVAMGTIYMMRTKPIKQQIIHEANPWTSHH